MSSRSTFSCFLSLVFLASLASSQVIIREKVEVKPSPALRSIQGTPASEIRVESSFDGPVDPTYAHIIYLKGPCGVGLAGDISATLTAPAYDGVYTIGYTVTSPSGGGFRFAVYLGDSLLWLTQGPVNCPTGCTLKGERNIRLYGGFTFWPQYALIGSGGANYFGAAESTATVPCSLGPWFGEWPIELEITKGQDVGSFVDGATRTYKVVKKKTDFYTLAFIADGEKGYGDVEITARSGGLTVVRGFKVVAPAPTIKIVSPWWWRGDPITLAFDNLPVLDFSETHTPRAGQKFEPVITWDPNDTINTADYYNVANEVYVKVRAENAGGVARDSVKLEFETECIKVNFDPPEVSTGDTARLSFQRVNEDGTLDDLPRGSYAFSVMIVGGEDSSKGLFVTEEQDPFEEPKIGTTLLNETSPILYVAPATIQDTVMKAQVIASAWEVTWGKIGEVKNPRAELPGVQAARVTGPNAKSAKVDAHKTVLLSGWCPISQVVVKGSPLEHFLVTVEPDTIVHGDTATVHVQPQDNANENIELDGETLLNALLDAAGQTYGKLIGAAVPGPLLEMSYEEVKAGKLRYVADGEDPTGLPAQQVKISVVLSDDETREGIGTVAVKASIERFCQGDSGWAGTKYDNYVKKDRNGNIIKDEDGNPVYYGVGNKGCALTCMAMVAKAGGVDTDPGKLAAYMNDSEHYGFTPAHGVIWNAIDSLNGRFAYDGFSGDGLKYKSDKITVDLQNSKTVSTAKMDPFLNAGSLIIAQVYNKTTNNGHWVVVAGKTGSEYSILDPGCYSGRTTLKNGYGNYIYRFIVYSKD